MLEMQKWYPHHLINVFKFHRDEHLLLMCLVCHIILYCTMRFLTQTDLINDNSFFMIPSMQITHILFWQHLYPNANFYMHSNSHSPTKRKELNVYLNHRHNSQLLNNQLLVVKFVCKLSLIILSRTHCYCSASSATASMWKRHFRLSLSIYVSPTIST